MILLNLYYNIKIILKDVKWYEIDSYKLVDSKAVLDV